MVQFSAVYAMDGLVINGKTYTEGGLHRPPINADLNANQATMIDWWSLVTPRPGEEYSVMELPTPSGHAGMPSGIYDPATMWPIRFIAVKLAAHLTNVEYVYGWVDEVTVKVMKGQNRVIVIRWHPDWYLTMRDSVHYGAGRILRGPQELARPDDTPPRMWVEDTIIDLGNRVHPWIIVLYTKNETISGKTFTYYKLAFWQYGVNVNSIPSPNRNDMYDGLLEEILEIDPNAILGVWGCPLQPTPATSPKTNSQQTRGWYEGNPGDIISYILWEDQNNTYKTDDTAKWMITDPTGSIMGTLPWGIEFDTVTAIIDIGPAGAYLHISTQLTHTGNATEGLGEGRIFTVPLPSIPVTENAMQSYSYSGEREYDKTMREIQKEQAAVNGIAGVGTSAIGGAVAGSLAGGPAGTAAGAIAGIVSSTVGTAVNYVSAGHFDRKTQEAVDKLKSNQTAGTIVSAGGVQWLDGVGRNGRLWTLLKMVRDTVSAAEISAEHDELGYPTDSYSTNCSSIIASGGGLRIEGLVTYNVTPEASRYIEALFARGVHIDISSP